MANFIKFKTNGRLTLVNTEQITFVGHNVEHVNIGTPVWDESSAIISFSGDTENYIVVDEPFEKVCDKLIGCGERRVEYDEMCHDGTD